MSCIRRLRLRDWGNLFHRQATSQSPKMREARDQVINRELAQVRQLTAVVKNTADQITESAKRIQSIVDQAQGVNHEPTGGC